MNPPKADLARSEGPAPTFKRRLPIGAEPAAPGVHFRVWAPRASRVELEIHRESFRIPLVPEADGYFSVHAPQAAVGTRYRFLVDGRGPFPDPASRFQPEGPHGPSEVISPAFSWTDESWRGVPPSGQVLYELHPGTFTPAGTWEAAVLELPRLKELGVTVLEVMPVADFPGRFGWGYDGVNLFAPSRLYGRPDEFRRFVDRAHALGLGVILDVVYNHLGPDGNYLGEFSGHYFTDRHPTEWGLPLNFDGPHSGPVREYFRTNALYWVTEYHLDGLRFDATQAIYDDSEEHILESIQGAVREAARPREVYLIGENEPQDASLARPVEAGGKGLDALWNDDFHHAARVALTGSRESYFTDYRGTPQELISALKWGFLYQGQRYSWQKKARGTPALEQPSTAFVNFLENHDQVANSGHGKRLWELCSPGCYRALTAALLLGPGTPLLFQGQEYASSRPFLYFADHQPPLGTAVARGRMEFLSQAASLSTPEAQEAVPDPLSESSFVRCKLDPSELERHGRTLALHKDLLAIRKNNPAIGRADRNRFHGAVLGPQVFLLRWLDGRDSGLLLVNLGPDYCAVHAPEPLLAPPEGGRWRLILSTESPRYGGRGVAPLYKEGSMFVQGASAVFLQGDPP